MKSKLPTFVPPKRFSCKDATTHLSEFLDGELSGESRVLFEQHIGACEQCFYLAHDSAHLLEVAKSIAVTPIPPAVSQRLRARLQQTLGLPNSNLSGKLTLIVS